MRFQVIFDGVVVEKATAVPVKDQDELQAILNAILRELAKLAIRDPFARATSDDGGIEVGINVDEVDAYHASFVGSTLIRTGVHAAGIGTPGWSVDWVKTITARSEDRRSADEAVPA